MPLLRLGRPTPCLTAIGSHCQQGDPAQRQHIDPTRSTIQLQLGGIAVHPAAVLGFNLIGLQQLTEFLRLANVCASQGRFQLFNPRQPIFLAQRDVVLHQLFQICLHLQHQRDQALTGLLHRFQLLAQFTQLILLIGHQRLHVAVVGFEVTQLQLGVLQLQSCGNGGIGGFFHPLLGGFPGSYAVLEGGSNQLIPDGSKVD